MDYEEYKRKALEPIVNYIKSVMASYSEEELEARIKKALPEKESEDERIRKILISIVKDACDKGVKYEGNEIGEEKLLAYLEKQKDNKFTPRALPCSAAWFEDGEEFEQKEQKPEVFKIPAAPSVGMPKTPPAYKLDVKPAEWSEEDENIINGAVGALEAHGHEKLAKRLKSLRPQPHWKPSKEQIDAIHEANYRCRAYQFATHLTEIEIQLEKLMNE